MNGGSRPALQDSRYCSPAPRTQATPFWSKNRAAQTKVQLLSHRQGHRPSARLSYFDGSFASLAIPISMRVPFQN
eukprot:5036469-Alexandrium_andersonii.AAC.1